jgi:hypothetical protein
MNKPLRDKLGIRLLKIGLSGAKSFFSAITQVAWGLVSLFGLNIIIVYLMSKNNMILPPEVDKTFLLLSAFIIEHMMIFVFIFWIVYWYIDYKELKK